MSSKEKKNPLLIDKEFRDIHQGNALIGKTNINRDLLQLTRLNTLPIGLQVLTWALFLLVQDPEYEKLCFQEVDKWYADNGDSPHPFTIESMKELPYLR